MRELIIKLADELHDFDDAHPLLAEVDSALATPDEPVLLRDKEINDICSTQSNYPGYNFVRAIEQAVLKANGIGGDK